MSDRLKHQMKIKSGMRACVRTLDLRESCARGSVRMSGVMRGRWLQQEKNDAVSCHVEVDK